VYGYASTRDLVPKFLKELRLDYIDMVLLHAPASLPPWVRSPECAAAGLGHKGCRQATWKALSEAVAAGQLRSVGVSNFNRRQMEELVEQGQGYAPARVANNQFQYVDSLRSVLAQPACSD
jgi:diketogulonate reductase-like aldo/keto reductase